MGVRPGRPRQPHAEAGPVRRAHLHDRHRDAHARQLMFRLRLAPLRMAALRAERSIPSLLIPVFEQTVERALALAASMESRGFAATRTVEGVCERPVVMTGASLDFDGGWRLEGLDLTLAPGTLTVLTGSTGSGQSSL